MNDIVELAEDAITDVFNDRSVSQSETKERLGGLIDFINTMLNTLED